jgi:hypothetical protein
VTICNSKLSQTNEICITELISMKIYEKTTWSVSQSGLDLYIKEEKGRNKINLNLGNITNNFLTAQNKKDVLT